jgi:pyruvate ferredoxin oxidoreductase gamma subunit
MYRIRLHGRGGQGIKTAGRMLGTAFFAEGFEVQDAPRYGAERRGAPIFATVRASRRPIHERGLIPMPDLVVVADDTLVPVATAGVLMGVREGSVLLIASAEPAAEWKARLRLEGAVFTLPAGPDEGAEHRFAGAACAGATARLVDVISRPALEAAVREELADLGSGVVAANLESALAAYDGFGAHAGCVREGPELAPARDEAPDWVDLPFEPADLSAPDIHATATSVQVRTGLWRTMRPVIDHDRCHHCTWVCSTLCPDAAIAVDAEGSPRIDYDHCKGCLVCVAVCPPHAIRAVPEHRAAETSAESAGRRP